MRITTTERELQLTELDDIIEAIELVQEDIAEHGLKHSDYAVGHIIIEVEE